MKTTLVIALGHPRPGPLITMHPPPTSPPPQPPKGHEDHIGALPWVIPALDPTVPVYAGGFVLQLVARRLQEFNLYDPAR